MGSALQTQIFLSSLEHLPQCRESRSSFADLRPSQANFKQRLANFDGFSDKFKINSLNLLDFINFINFINI